MIYKDEEEMMIDMESLKPLLPENIAETQRVLLEWLDVVDQARASLEDFAEAVGTSRATYGDEIFSDRIDVAEHEALERLGTITWLMHRQKEIAKIKTNESSEDTALGAVSEDLSCSCCDMKFCNGGEGTYRG